MRVFVLTLNRASRLINRRSSTFPKNVDSSALPVVYGTVRIFAGGVLDRLGDRSF